jgi:hypothetical protein
MEVVKAEPIIDDSSDDETLYQYTVELIEIDKLLLSVFNVQTGITFKTYMDRVILLDYHIGINSRNL